MERPLRPIGTGIRDEPDRIQSDLGEHMRERVRAHGSAGGSRRWSLVLALSATAVGVAALVAASLSVREAAAYPAWSTSRTTGYCATCHGDFRASGYVSKNDGVPWVAGTSLHNGHRSNMLNSDCNTCHTSSRFPTDLGNSTGGSGFSPIGCLGCHGRAEPSQGGMVTGTGLRQHHTKNASATCGGSGCHSDAEPLTTTAASETVKPPFYFGPDPAHPNKPTDPCNADGMESLVSAPSGLDNDGDNVYDSPDCVVTGVDPFAGPTMRLEGARPNPTVGGHLRVVFTLDVLEPATLEAIDVSGRRVASQEVGRLGPGRHVVDLAPDARLAPGIYMLRLTQGARSFRTTAIVVR